MKLRRLSKSILALGLCVSMLAIPNISVEAAGLPKDAVLYEGHYYKLYDKTTTWEKAKKACEKMGGHLVTITDANENDFVYSLMKDTKCYDFWIGATDKKKEGTFEWVTGEEFQYTKWSEGEPSNSYGGEEDYVGIYKANGCWNDYTNSPEMSPYIGYICEWEFSVKADYSEITLGAGGFDYLNGRVIIANAEAKDLKVSYSSSDKTVVTVSKKGKITAKKPGRAYITVKYGDVYTKVTVNVSPEPVESVRLKKSYTNRITLSWKKQSDVTGYEVWMYSDARKNYKLVATNTQNLSYATARDLSAGKSYKFKVRSYVQKGSQKYYGDFSDVLVASTKTSTKTSTK